MLIEIGHVEAIFRYPVKSMAGEGLDGAELGWHGDVFGLPSRENLTIRRGVRTETSVDFRIAKLQ
jgi:hypothetical protein